MDEETRRAKTRQAAGFFEYLVICVGACRWVSTLTDGAKPLGAAISIGASFALCLVYALLKPEIVCRIFSDAEPRMTVSERMAAFRSDAVSLLLGGVPAYGFLMWSFTWLPRDAPVGWLAIGVAVVTLALFVGGLVAGHYLDRALSSSKAR